jgi:hypothetical protein
LLAWLPDDDQPQSTPNTVLLERDEIRRNPGSAGGVFRTLDVLPGVVSTFDIVGASQPSDRWTFSAKWKYALGRPNVPGVNIIEGLDEGTAHHRTQVRKLLDARQMSRSLRWPSAIAHRRR